MGNQVLLILALTFCASGLSAHEDEFYNLPTSQLSKLREKAQARSFYIDQYQRAKYGLSPKGRSTTGQDLRRFERAMIQWRMNTRVSESSSDGRCLLFLRNTLKILTRLDYIYKDAIKQPMNSPRDFMARSRADVMTSLLDSERSLADNGAEGGLSPVTDKPNRCNLVDRDLWLLLLDHVEEISVSTSEHLWGKRGVFHAFPVSGFLLSQINRQVVNHNTWDFTREFISGTTGIALFSLISNRYGAALPALMLASYGAFRGYSWASQRPELPITSDPWSKIQLSVQNALQIRDDDIQTYYHLCLALESSLLERNQYITTELAPEMAQVAERFGSLKAAQDLALQKIKEIDRVMKERK